MKIAAKWRAGSASDPGLLRTVNEDRVWFDDTHGIFLVVDGLGGHAAGEIAAATAVDVVRQNLKVSSADMQAHIRAVICAANNEIFRLAEENPAQRGMACVLTLAVMQEDRVVVGHVGDSRLYLFWNGKLKKITSDHSPVGEQEDQGLLTELEAMRHPRRNEVFRDVGSMPRLSDDSHFIETRSFLFPDDAALMLCSDGLTDLVPASEITRILEQFDGDASRSAQMLVEAANAAGGKDNISVVFAAGPEFAGTDSPQSQDARSRHATTRARADAPVAKPRWTRYLLVALICIGVALALWRIIIRVTTVPAPAAAAVISHTIEINAADARGIMDALNTAVSGQTILVPPGEFLGPLILKEGVDIVAKDPRQTVVRSDPSAPAEQGIAIVARGVQKALVNGLRVASDDTHPLHTGVLLVDSSVDLVNLDISGAAYSGIRIEGDSRPRVSECFVHANGGAGIGVGDHAEPVLVRNQIIQNGLMVNAARPGIEVGPNAKPVLDGNLVSGNGADEPLKTGHAEARKKREDQ
jgi:serine/threonine protein phosphatase PrpC